jgi:hypothetical protein
MSGGPAVKNVDFLPAEFRHKSRDTSSRGRAVLLGTVTVALLSGLTWLQIDRLRTRRTELASLRQQKAAVEVVLARLANTKTALESADAEAELYTWLRHPRPRSQVLLAILEGIPEEIRLFDVEVSTRSEANSVRTVQTGEEKSTKPAAAKALELLRQASPAGSEWAHVYGATENPAALHLWLGRLGRHPMFSRCELVSIEESANGEDSPAEFHAEVRIKPSPAASESGTSRPDADFRTAKVQQ